MDYAIRKYKGKIWYVSSEVWMSTVEALAQVEDSPNIKCEVLESCATMILEVY